MAKALLVIVSGPPASGKTTIGQRIARDFKLPFFHKDGFKEILYETLRPTWEGWSDDLSSASWEILFSAIEALMQNKLSLVVEGNFKTSRHGPRFATLLKKYRYKAVEIYCRSKDEVLFERFRTRHEKGERHPAHPDSVRTIDEYKERLLSGTHEPLSVDNHVIRLGTDDFSAIDYKSIVDRIRSDL